MTMVRVRRHIFAPSGETDWRGRSAGCGRCPLPADNDIHQVPEQDPETLAAERRRIGERDGGQ